MRNPFIRRESGHYTPRGQGGPFLPMNAYACAIFKRSNQNVHENQQQNHEQDKIKLNTLKRSSFSV